MCERYKHISFLYYCDVIKMIVRTQKKNNKIEQEKEVKSFYGYEPTDIELFLLVLNVAHS